jgi:hypothetical protein
MANAPDAAGKYPESGAQPDVKPIIAVCAKPKGTGPILSSRLDFILLTLSDY